MASVRKREWTSNGEIKTAWVCEYTDAAGKRRRKTFEKKKDADKYRDRVQGEIERGEHTAEAESATVAKVCDEYLKWVEERKRSGAVGTSMSYKHTYAVNKYIVPTIGKVKFSQLSWKDMDAMRATLSHLHPKTAEGYMIILKLVEDFAIRREYTKKKVAREYKADLGSGKKTKVRVPEIDQVLAILKVVDVRPKNFVIRGNLMLRCFVHLAAFCGLRFGEITGLTTDDLDLAGRTLRVRHSLTYWDELKEPKTAAGVRDVPIPAHVADLLREWMEQHLVAEERRLVFRSAGGCPINSANFHRQFWHPLLKRAGVWNEEGDQLHFHGLRHFTVSFMLNQGVPVTEVAKHVGHSRTDITLNTYAHALASAGQRAATVDRLAGDLLGRAQLAPQPISVEVVGERDRKDQKAARRARQVAEATTARQSAVSA